MGPNGPSAFVVIIMKLRNIIFFALIISSKIISAATMEESLALMQSYLDKNQLEKVEDYYDDNEETLSKNPMALERVAISLERREKYKEAIEIYRKIILNFNKVEHGKILSSKPSRIDPSFYEHTKLPFYYYKLSYLSTQLFLKTTTYSPLEERVKFKRNADGFILLSRKVKVDELDLKALEEVLKEKITEERSMLYKKTWYASADLMSWQDRVILVNNASQTRTNLLSTSMGTCIGAGRKWENAKYEFNLEGCYATGTSSISSEDRFVDYQQSSVAVSGVIFGPGMYFKTISDNILLGLHLPIKYRKGNWTNPRPDLYTFERESAIEAGFFIQSKIKINKISIRTRLGKVFPNPGSLWSVGALYDF
jgi:tetratricopeptide (TPR) repeat protein